MTLLPEPIDLAEIWWLPLAYRRCANVTPLRHRMMSRRRRDPTHFHLLWSRNRRRSWRNRTLRALIGRRRRSETSLRRIDRLFIVRHLTIFGFGLIAICRAIIPEPFTLLGHFTSADEDASLNFLRHSACL
jgi:hypothetical protein